MTPLEHATDLLARGWSPVPVPFKSKKPVLDAWQTLRLTEETLPNYFNGEPSNVGMLLGEPSGGRVDVDLDCREAIVLTSFFLPATPCRFGRKSRGESHLEYMPTSAMATEKWKDVEANGAEGEMLVEIRSTGGQTIAPGNVHPSGELVEWYADGEPAEVDAAELRRAVTHLAVAAMLARHWPERGGRHETALAAAGFLMRANLDEAAVANIVTAAARGAGDPEWSDRRRAAIDTVAAIAAGEPATGGPTLADLLRGAGEKVVQRLRKWLGAEGRDEAGFNLTDVGNARRLVSRYGADLRYSFTLRSWFSWTGARWERDPGHVVMAFAKHVPPSMYLEAAGASDPEARAAIAAWARRSEHEARIRAAVFLAQSEPGIPIDVARFDADPWALNLLNGVMDLHAAQLRAHRSEDHLTKLAPIAYDVAAACPRWLAFLSKIFDNKERLIRFVQKAIGYALTGVTSEQVFFLLYGGGANGKTTLLRTIAHVLGDYAMSTRAETFMVKGPDAIPNDVARLRGARFVTAVEADNGQRLAEALVKQMTGGTS